jgi:hypothetical protein
MEMRQKAIKGQKVSQSEKIVRRELKKVLTNGTGACLVAGIGASTRLMPTETPPLRTVSDATFLAGDDASHCVAIKVCLRPS